MLRFFTCIIVGFSLAATCTSCARFRPEARSADALPLPSEFTLYPDTEPAPERWWEAFQSEELNVLVEGSLDGNLSLRQMFARLTQAEMVARQAGAALKPSLNATGDLSGTLRHADQSPGTDHLDETNRKLGAVSTLVNNAAGAGSASALSAAQSSLQAANTLLTQTPEMNHTATSRSYRFGLGSSYEIDLWGRVRAQEKAALLDLESSKEDVHGAMLSLSGLVVRQWLSAVAQEQGLALMRQQLELNKTTLERIELYWKNGQATALDIYQQRQIVAQTESLAAPLESALQTAHHELAVLLGRPPRADLSIQATALPQAPPLPTPGLPADLLARRPDVRSSGLRLASSDWRLGAAQADRLPSIRLSASASYGAEEFGLIFNNWMATLAGSLTGPIFDGGRRKAEVERSRAVVDERLAAYQANVLEAVKEVENTLFQEQKQVEYTHALESELEMAEHSHQLALERFSKGLNDYLPVLSALSRLQVLERNLLRAERERLELRVQLYVALGGAWMEEQVGQRNAQQGIVTK
jgi:outer membrane protein, multidrug efflux system